MKLLAIDTATEICSATVLIDDARWSREQPTQRSHADLILPMIHELLKESGLELADLDCIAFGRGPGSFTGVRIAVGVVQGLALARRLPVVGVSNLAAVALRASEREALSQGEILVCMDARMQETYWARYRLDRDALVELIDDEHVTAPESVDVETENLVLGAGTAWTAYPELPARFSTLKVLPDLLPRAQEIARLARRDFQRGRSVTAAEAQPTYLRNEVVNIAR